MKSELEGSREDIQVEFLHLDLSSLQSARDFAENFLAKGLPLHLLILNAGIGNADLGKQFTRTVSARKPAPTVGLYI